MTMIVYDRVLIVNATVDYIEDVAGYYRRQRHPAPVLG